MLIFSSFLNIKPEFTKKEFIDLVIEWNNTGSYAENIIPNVVWNGENEAFFGDAKRWMKIIVYDRKNIVAVRYEKNTADNVVWDTDYIMNFDERKMVIRLDRSYKNDVQLFNNGFSTPHFISLLIQHGYIQSDRNIPVLREPIGIGEKHADVLGRIINGQAKYRMPVVYVSKNNKGSYPLNIKWLASRLKGVAHVLVQAGKHNETITKACDGKNPKDGAIGIYFPEKLTTGADSTYKDADGERLLDQVVNEVIKYSMVHNLSPMYTWYGVNSMILSDMIENQRKERIEAENELRSKESEAYELVDILEEDINSLKSQNDDLNNRISALECEVGGLRKKLNTTNAEPVLYTGRETEAFPGEIKCILTSVLKDMSEKMEPGSRRKDIIDDIIAGNYCEDILQIRQMRVKSLLKGYKVLNTSMKQELIGMGFTITEDGKHYKLTYNNDNRYMVTIAKTPSDSRTGSNTAAMICREML